jgi:hypothetical protein
MHMMVHCPGCHQALQVPTEASGRYARCPVCRTKFVIPNPNELFEETVSSWIEEDLDQFISEQDETADDVAAGKTTDQPPQRDESPRDNENLTPDTDAADQPRPQSPVDDRPEKPTAVRAASQLASGDTVFAVEVGARTDRPAPKRDQAAPPPRRVHAAPPPSTADYPQQLHVTEPIPRLMVKEVFQQGVSFCFDSIWVVHDGFRAAMPVACAFCGEGERKKLVSKPMAFLDRAMDKNKTAREIEHDHEHGVRDRGPGDLLHITGRITGMLKPFDSPVLYYTCPNHRQQALECGTVDRGDGGVTCEVLVPHRPTALAWLARVNGVCGPEYALLERDVTAMTNEAWDDLPENCRQRLAVWCKFAPGERFRDYLPDADLARHDVGLAGVVITDDRLIYHKYRLFGEVRLDTDATLVVRRDDRIAVLGLEKDGKRVRIAKIHARDLPQLIVALSHAPGLKVTVAKAPGSAGK